VTVPDRRHWIVWAACGGQRCNPGQPRAVLAITRSGSTFRVWTKNLHTGFGRPDAWRQHPDRTLSEIEALEFLPLCDRDGQQSVPGSELGAAIRSKRKMVITQTPANMR
jgi:hypothetical protein